MPEQEFYMDDVIDIRQVIRTLLRYRGWIVALTLGAAVVALVVSLLLPPTYEATALAVMTPTQYKLQFDPRIETVINPVDMQIDVYTGLATSDDVVQKLFASLTPLPQGVENIADLQDALTVTGKNGLLTFTVKARSPEDASRVANAWVQIFVTQANRVYGTNDEEQLAFFQAQFSDAGKKLQAAEDALTEFVAQDKTSILQNRLDSLNNTQRNYLSTQNALLVARQDVESLLQKLESQTNTSTTEFSDQMSAFFLELRVFNGQGNYPVQLQLSDPASFSSLPLSEQKRTLRTVLTIIDRRMQDLDTELQALEPQILEMQAELKQAQLERDRLERELSLARDTYTALAHKVDETRIVTNDSVGQVRIASQALTPLKPVAPRKLLNTVLAGVVGAMLAIGGAFAVEWWREEGEQPVSEPVAAD
ncbi:MAG: hypothetical protein D6755_04665 [Anaerolineae bacterium]|nr:MAG: hypothetical protein D6755_04665 [Anaerolineae bacterium]